MRATKAVGKPEATPELVVETAKKYIAVFGGDEINMRVLDKVVSQLADTYCVHEYLATEAEKLYKLEKNPDLLVFQNSRVTYMVTDGNEYWQTIKAVKSNEPNLGDMKSLVATLIEKHGAEAPFSLNSDRGDEYFTLRLKKREV